MWCSTACEYDIRVGLLGLEDPKAAALGAIPSLNLTLNTLGPGRVGPSYSSVLSIAMYWIFELPHIKFKSKD